MLISDASPAPAMTRSRATSCGRTRWQAGGWRWRGCAVEFERASLRCGAGGAEPACKIGESAAAGQRLALAAIGARNNAVAERREEAEIDVHRLEAVRVGADGDMGEKGAECGGRRRRARLSAASLGGGEAAGEQAYGGALDIALDAGDLAGEAQPRHRLQPQCGVEKFRAVEEGVAVQAAEPRELSAL